MDENNYIKEVIERIDRRVAAIEGSVNRIEALERGEIEYINAIKNMESKELEGLEKLHALENSELSKMDGLKPLKYNDLMMWKNSIWENCSMKIIIDSKTMVLFNCKLTGKVCCFSNCPRNIIGND